MKRLALIPLALFGGLSSAAVGQAAVRQPTSPAGLTADIPASTGLQPGDAPGFTVVDPGVYTWKGPTPPNDFVKAWDECTTSSPILSSLDKQNSSQFYLVSDAYGQGSNPNPLFPTLTTPQLSLVSVVFGTGPGDPADVADLQGALSVLAGSAFQHCYTATLDSNNRAEGFSVPVQPSTVRPISTSGLPPSSTAFSVHEALDTGQTQNLDNGFTVISNGRDLTSVLITSSVNATFPDPLRLHVASLLASRMGIITPGGTGGHAAENWTMLSGPQPNGTGVIAPDESGILYFDDSDPSFPQTWHFSGDTWTELRPTIRPQGAVMGMAYDSSRHQVVLLVGDPSQAAGAVTWTWSAGAWTERKPAHQPPFRVAAAMAYDATSQRMIVVGGRSSSRAVLADTWAWNGQDWQRMDRQGQTQPPARDSAALAWAPGQHGLVLFGGSSGLTNFDDMWRYQQGSWSRLTPPLIPLAGTYRMVWEPGLSPPRVSLVGSSTDGRWHDWSGDDGTYWLDRNTPSAPALAAGSQLAFDAVDKELVVVGVAETSQLSGIPKLQPETWVVREPSWLLPGCHAPDSSCGGVADSVKRQYGLDPFAVSTADDGLADAWKLSDVAPGAGFDVAGRRISVPTAVAFGPFSRDPGPVDVMASPRMVRDPQVPPCDRNTTWLNPGRDDGCVDGNGLVSPDFSHLNYPPDRFHADVYVEVDWEDCKYADARGQLIDINLPTLCPDYSIADEMHHAPNVVGLKDVVGMFSHAPVNNPDGTSGINLNILVANPLPHTPNCQQAIQDAGGVDDPNRAFPDTTHSAFTPIEMQKAADKNQLNGISAAQLTSIRSSVFRFAWSGHSTRVPSTTACPSPDILGQLTDLPFFDLTPYGDANRGGRDILLSVSISWQCPARIFGCFSGREKGGVYAGPSIFTDAHVAAHSDGVVPNNDKVDVQWPVEYLLGFGWSYELPLRTDPALEQLWGRVFAHMLGVALGLTDAQAANDPSAPALVLSGQPSVRLPDSYASWSGLTLAPRGRGTPLGDAGLRSRLPPFDRLSQCSPGDFSAVTGGLNVAAGKGDGLGYLVSANDPCIVSYLASTSARSARAAAGPPAGGPRVTETLVASAASAAPTASRRPLPALEITDSSLNVDSSGSTLTVAVQRIAGSSSSQAAHAAVLVEFPYAPKQIANPHRDTPVTLVVGQSSASVVIPIPAAGANSLAVVSLVPSSDSEVSLLRSGVAVPSGSAATSAFPWVIVLPTAGTTAILALGGLSYLRRRSAQRRSRARPIGR